MKVSRKPRFYRFVCPIGEQLVVARRLRQAWHRLMVLECPRELINELRDELKEEWDCILSTPIEDAYRHCFWYVKNGEIQVCPVNYRLCPTDNISFYEFKDDDGNIVVIPANRSDKAWRRLRLVLNTTQSIKKLRQAWIISWSVVAEDSNADYFGYLTNGKLDWKYK